MKKMILLSALLASLAVLEACSTSTSSDSDEKKKLAVETMSELPNCTKSKEGLVAYLTEDKDTVVCVSEVWRIIGTGVKAESSNDEIEESSSSISEESSSSEDTPSHSKRSSSSTSHATKSSASQSSSSSATELSSSSVINESSSSVEVTVKRFSMTDPRDMRVYKVVSIGAQVWMAENMNYDGAEIAGASAYLGWCYGNEDRYCDTSGRLSNWKTAKNICPEGWHLPDVNDWRTLISTVGDSLTAGRFLKSKDSWMEVANGDSLELYGLDTYEFAARI